MPKKKIKASNVKRRVTRRASKKTSLFSSIFRLPHFKLFLSLAILVTLGLSFLSAANNGKTVLGSSISACGSVSGEKCASSCPNGTSDTSTCSMPYQCCKKSAPAITPKPTSKPIKTPTPTPKPIALKAPTGLTATTSCAGDLSYSALSSTMDFKWAKVSGAVGYNFYYKLGQYNNYSPKNTTSASYYLGNLPVGTTVYWYVNAYKNGSLGNVLNSNSLGPNSAVASKATNACKPLPGKFNLYTVSTDCAKATAVAPTDTAYNTLKWNYATNAEYYTVHWKYAKSSYQNIKIGGLDKDEYPIYSEINKKGTVISWYVTATNRYGSTNSSDPKKVGTTKVPNCY